MFIFLFILTFSVITAVGLSASAVLTSHFDPSANYLAVGGSVADCELLSVPVVKMLYSHVTVVE